MTSQKLLSSVPSKWQERFLIKRIDEEDIEISLEERDRILEALQNGARFIQIKKFTLMVNSIKSIDPKWGEKNIPPRPQKQIESVFKGNDAIISILNEEEIAAWDNLFG